MKGKHMESSIVTEFISSLKMGEPDSYRNLTVFPLFSDCTGENIYTLLDEAIMTKQFIVTEVSEGGQVPELRAVNKLDSDILIIDGEQLIGAKQNRIVNTTIIVEKGSSINIPVSCVEQGRWRYRSKTFAPGRSNLYADLRKKKSKSVYANLKSSMKYSSDQREIWNDISEKSARFEVRSDTEAMNDIFESHEEEIKKYESSFQPHAGQVGFIAFIGNRVAGSDIFGYKSILPKVYPKLMRGYILDAVDRDIADMRLLKDKEENPGNGESLYEKVKHFFDGVNVTEKEIFKSVGAGTEARFGNKHVQGFALVNNEEIVHLAAFAE